MDSLKRIGPIRKFPRSMRERFLCQGVSEVPQYALKFGIHCILSAQRPSTAADKPRSGLAFGGSAVLDRDVQEGLRVLVRDGQQSPGWTRWNATALLPLLECSNRHAKQTCELRLGQTDLFSGRRHRWEVLNTTDLASFELANAFQNLYANVAILLLRHLRFPRGSASERALECSRPRSIGYRVSIQTTPCSGRRK